MICIPDRPRELDGNVPQNKVLRPREREEVVAGTMIGVAEKHSSTELNHLAISG
jgi:hypothetical protein